jgi:hypothetical protein
MIEKRKRLALPRRAVPASIRDPAALRNQPRW